jgi:hypothetical protein
MLRQATRYLLGIATTSLLAGPLVVIISILCIGLARFTGLYEWQAGQSGTVTLEGFLVWTAGSILFGIWLSVPASIVNAAVLGSFASRGINSSTAAAAVGFFGGWVVLGTLIYMGSLPPPFTPFAVIAMGYHQQIAIIVTGTLMGLLQWLIIVRPRR